MLRTNHRIIAATFADSILFNSTVAISAQAQSSFGSSSINTVSSQDAKSIRYTKLYKEVFSALGHQPNPTAQTKADELLRQALNGELKFDNDPYEETSLMDDRYSSVERLTSDQLDLELSFLEIIYADLGNYPNPLLL